MRKIAFLLMTIAIFGLAACSGRDGIDGRDGRDGKDGVNGQDGKDGEGSGAYWFTKSFTINEADWELMGEENAVDSRYGVTVDIPELSQWVYDKGAVIAYVGYEDTKRFGLPHVEHRSYEDDPTYQWTETTDFQTEKGKISFYVTYSNFLTGINTPETQTFHVVLLWD